MSDKNGAPVSFYKNFSTQTLESMLRDMTLSDAELDVELYKSVLNELNSREGAPETLAPEDALKIFEEEYSGNESIYLDCAHEDKETQTSPAEPIPSRRKYSFSRVILVAAAMSAILFGSLMVAQAAGANVFGAIANWTDEHFGFGTSIAIEKASEREQAKNWPPEPPEDLGAPEDFDYASNASVLGKYDSIQALLDAYRVVPEINAPTYIPEGYELVILDRAPSLNGTYFFASYEDVNGNCINIQYMPYSDEPGAEYEKTDDPVEIIEIENVTMYAFSNTVTEQIVWVTPHYEASIAGNVSREELIKIAQSIYMR